MHIVSLDVPHPADYGGVIDIFYKVKTLHSLGVRITLHCFAYGREPAPELESLCTEVIYYPRKTGLLSNLSRYPYIVSSRRDLQLLANLRKDDSPILFEGIHTAYPLIAGELGERRLMLRSHNIEHNYYRELTLREPNPIKKLYFLKEAILLQRLLGKLPHRLAVAAIARGDVYALESQFPEVWWLPPFHSNERITSRTGRGTYVLFHGNLSVTENLEIAQLLVGQFRGKPIPLVLAGKAPPADLVASVGQVSNITLLPDPDASTMHDLIAEAHVVVVASNQPTGIKLKLVESLYRGRFCVANRVIVRDTGLDDTVILEDINFYEASRKLMDISFTEEDVMARKSILLEYYDNIRNAKTLLRRLTGGAAGGVP